MEDEPHRRHLNKPPRASSYASLDAIRRRSQEVEEEAKRLRMPERGFHAATVPLPDLGPPDERMYGASPILGLPYEELVWKVQGGPAVVFRRFRVRIHGFDDD